MYIQLIYYYHLSFVPLYNNNNNNNNILPFCFLPSIIISIYSLISIIFILYFISLSICVYTYNLCVIVNYYAGMLCPIRDINKHGHRNRRKDSTQKFFMNSFRNGVSNSFYRTFRICSLLRNDSFRSSCQTRLKI